MKSVIRAATAAWAVAGALLLVSYQPSAQEADGEAASPIVTRDYDVRALVQRELWTAPRTGAIGDVLAPDRFFFDDAEHQLDQWSLRDSGEEARCWDSAEELGSDIRNLLSDAGVEVSEDSNAGRLTMQSDDAGHERVRWLLDAIKDVAAARVSMIVYRLPETTKVETPVVPANEVAGRAKGARFVGNFRGGLAEPFVLQQTEHRSYVADYDLNLSTEAVVAGPRVNNLNTGEEFVLGAVSLADGSVWLQGWHAEMRLTRMRTAETNSGTIELPEVSYSFTPVSAVIENGGAAVIDAGPAGRFMVRTDCDRVVRNRELKLENGKTIRLINCVGSMRGHGLGGFWLMNPTSSALFEDSMFPQVMLDDILDGPYFDSAYALYDSFGAEYSQARSFGPYLAAVVPAREEWSGSDLQLLNEELAQLDAIPVAPPMTGVRICAYEVADTAALPAGILTGRPSVADVEELKVLAGNKATFDRVSMCALRTQVDQFEVKMATHLRGYESSSATGVTALDPNVGTLVLGKQVRWQAREAGDGRLRIEVRSGITVGGAEFEKVAVGNDGLTVERSRSALTQGRLADELAAGERMAAISPGTGVEGQLVVIVVERLK
jgi:hypothetical protein